MLKGIIIEDDERDAKALLRILKNVQPKLSCVVFSDGPEALEHIRSQKKWIHIVFIDRQLPGMDGFTLAEKIRECRRYILTPIVFVTGYSMGQLNAFQEYHCYSYLVKPISEETVRQRIGPLLETLGREAKPKKLKRIMPFKIGQDVKLIDAETILGLEAMGRDCYLYAGTKSYRLPRQTIDMILREIDDPYFVRCHKSFAVNLKKVEDIKKERRNIWVPVFSWENDFSCEISKTYYKEIMELYQKYLSRAD